MDKTAIPRALEILQAQHARLGTEQHERILAVVNVATALKALASVALKGADAGQSMVLGKLLHLGMLELRKLADDLELPVNEVALLIELSDKLSEG